MIWRVGIDSILGILKCCSYKDKTGNMEHKSNTGSLTIASHILLPNEVNKTSMFRKTIFLSNYFVNIYLCINTYTSESKRGFKWQWWDSISILLPKPPRNIYVMNTFRVFFTHIHHQEPKEIYILLIRIFFNHAHLSLKKVLN